MSVAAACALAFIAVVAFVYEGTQVTADAQSFDRSIAQSLQQYRTPALTGRVIEVSALGSAPVLSMLALLAYSVIWRFRDRLAFLHLTVVALSGSILARLLQHVFARERPDTLLPFLVVTKGSFPSAHLFGATACYVTFAFLYARYAARRGTEIACYVAAALLVFCIGLTRVYLGAHHATDVLAGISGGAAWALVVAALFTRWYGAPRRTASNPAA